MKFISSFLLMINDNDLDYYRLDMKHIAFHPFLLANDNDLDHLDYYRQDMKHIAL